MVTPERDFGDRSGIGQVMREIIASVIAVRMSNGPLETEDTPSSMPTRPHSLAGHE
jgi:hypothetical protein